MGGLTLTQLDAAVLAELPEEVVAELRATLPRSNEPFLKAGNIASAEPGSSSSSDDDDGEAEGGDERPAEQPEGGRQQQEAALRPQRPASAPARQRLASPAKRKV